MKIKVIEKFKTVDLSLFPRVGMSLEEFKKLIDTSEYEGIYKNCKVNLYYDEYCADLDFFGEREESDEEYKKRLERQNKFEEKKKAEKLVRKQRDLSTIKTLIKKHNIKPEDLKDE